MRLLAIAIVFAPIRICSVNNRWEPEPWPDTVRWQSSGPVPFIEAPGNNAQVGAGTPLTLIGFVEDQDDWYESIETGWMIGAARFCSGQVLEDDYTTRCEATAPATPGEHRVTLSAADGSGIDGQATIVIRVVETAPPTIEITAPVADSAYDHDQPVPLVARVTDEDGATGHPVSWIVDEVRYASLTTAVRSDGIAATAAVFEPGDHSVVAEVRDGNHTVTASSTFTVRPDPDADTDSDTME